MPKDVAFQPGKFAPVVEVAQRDTGLPSAADANFTGLQTVSSVTLDVSLASARGSGASIVDPTPNSRLGMIIGLVLTARNVVEQLAVLSVHARVSSPLRSPRLDILEPIVRAYNYFGHFEIEGKKFVARGLERTLVRTLFNLRQFATPEIASATKYTNTIKNDLFESIDLDFYALLPSGDIGFQAKFDLKTYIVKLVASFSAHSVSVDVQLPVLRDILDVSTEDGLNALLRRMRLQFPSFTAPSRSFSETPTEEHKKAMKALFGNEYSTDGSVIPNALFVSSISHAYSTARRVTLERSANMKTTPIPKYEGGSACQLASLVDDVLVSETPLSLADSTIAVALATSYGAPARYRSTPGLERDELLRELVTQSLIKR